jgi:hypothetical protein
MVTMPGVTADQYDRVMTSAFGGQLADGELFHVAGGNEAGWWVIDAWDSREQCMQSMQKLMPALQAEGLSMSAPPQEFEIHALELSS